MGGASFPTHVKLCPPPTAKAEFVIINGVECEPYITSDYRLMMEHADEILVGTSLIMTAAKVEKGFIGIEENKPQAIALLTEKARIYPHIEIVPLKQKYPQGGEKQLVDAVVHREVPAPPAIPVNVGAIVQNVGTAYAVYQAVMKHKPLFERYVTVTGKKVVKPSNFLVRIGTPMSQLIEACGGMPVGENKVLAGGPMMGKALMTTDVPVCKGTNSVTILSDNDALRTPPSPCIRCAKCVNVCLLRFRQISYGSEPKKKISQAVSNVVPVCTLVPPIVLFSTIYVLARAPSWELSNHETQRNNYYE
jgi:electron transport complex protein RnfC